MAAEARGSWPRCLMPRCLTRLSSSDSSPSSSSRCFDFSTRSLQALASLSVSASKLLWCRSTTSLSIAQQSL